MGATISAHDAVFVIKSDKLLIALRALTDCADEDDTDAEFLADLIGRRNLSASLSTADLSTAELLKVVLEDGDQISAHKVSINAVSGDVTVEGFDARWWFEDLVSIFEDLSPAIEPGTVIEMEQEANDEPSDDGTFQVIFDGPEIHISSRAKFIRVEEGEFHPWP
jgi:hypothetical protein